VLRRFIPFDVSESTLRSAAGAIVAEYPGLDVHAVVGDFEHHLDLLPTGGRRLIAFLRGTDLVRDAGRLHAAYDDSAGVTAAFNRNVLSVLNRELGASFDLTRFEHVARFDTHDEWIEMRLRSTEAQTVPVPALGIEAVFTAGEEMRTEISAKFRPEGVERELDAAGLVLKEWWTDRAGDFALSLSVRG